MTTIPLSTNTLDTQTPVSNARASTQAELGRLIHAAIINTRFRQLLLANPMNIIDRGYLGESFHFPSEMKEQIRNVRAGNLEEFSSRMLQIVEAPSFSEMAVLHYR
jgi:hypothetical protein